MRKKWEKLIEVEEKLLKVNKSWYINEEKLIKVNKSWEKWVKVDKSWEKKWEKADIT